MYMQNLQARVLHKTSRPERKRRPFVDFRRQCYLLLTSQQEQLFDKERTCERFSYEKTVWPTVLSRHNYHPVHLFSLTWISVTSGTPEQVHNLLGTLSRTFVRIYVQQQRHRKASANFASTPCERGQILNESRNLTQSTFGKNYKNRWQQETSTVVCPRLLRLDLTGVEYLSYTPTPGANDSLVCGGFQGNPGKHSCCCRWPPWVIVSSSCVEHLGLLVMTRGGLLFSTACINILERHPHFQPHYSTVAVVQ